MLARISKCVFQQRTEKYGPGRTRQVIVCVRGVLSPLLSNIYQNAMDQELGQRGLAFSRYESDCNIYEGSRRGADRVLAITTEWIEQHLRLEVNATNSEVRRPWERKYLGFRINLEGKIEAAHQLANFTFN